MLVTFVSDYGQADEFVGVCHAVIAGLAPDARIVDLGHSVPRHDVRSGALLLRRALPYCPAGVHLAVVDPEVGAERRAVALRCAEDDRLLVGPDNGLLWPAAERFGGIVQAVEVTRSPHRLQPVSATFHGRDIFAPVAGALAAGAPLEEAGDPLHPEEIVRLQLPRPTSDGDGLLLHALAFDGFGNAMLDADHEALAGTGLRLGRPVVVEIDGRRHDALFARTFADVPAGALLVYEDASRTLALAVNRGSAREELGLAPDTPVRLHAP